MDTKLLYKKQGSLREYHLLRLFETTLIFLTDKSKKQK